MFPPGTVLDFGPQSICVEAKRDPDFPIIYNCVVHHCFQIERTELVAFTLTFNSKVLILQLLSYMTNYTVNNIHRSN